MGDESGRFLPMRAGDLELARAVTAGHRAASEELVERLQDRVRTACRVMAGSSGDWEDLAQTVMIEILRSTGTYSGEGSLESWAGTIMMRALWKHIRRRARYRWMLTMFRLDTGEGADRQYRGADYRLDSQAARERIVQHLERISPKQRMCLVMRFVFGYSIQEIASMTGSPEETVKDRLKRGRAKLRRIMGRDSVLGEFLERGT